MNIGFLLESDLILIKLFFKITFHKGDEGDGGDKSLMWILLLTIILFTNYGSDMTVVVEYMVIQTDGEPLFWVLSTEWVKAGHEPVPSLLRVSIGRFWL